MESLNLRLAPPRKPTDLLGGVIFMARTVDKVRATLPGGDLGVYQVEGFTQSDDDIAARLLKHTTQEAREQVNAKLSAITIRDRNDSPNFFERYPVAKELPPETPLLEMLDYDDRAMFAA